MDVPLKSVKDVNEQAHSPQETIIPQFMKDEILNEKKEKDKPQTAESTGSLASKTEDLDSAAAAVTDGRDLTAHEDEIRDKENYSRYMKEAEQHKANMMDLSKKSVDAYERMALYIDTDMSKFQFYSDEGRKYAKQAKLESIAYKECLLQADSYK